MINIDNMEKRTIQILRFIKKNPGCQVKDVQEFIGLSRPVVSSSLKSMEELDFIKREFGEGRSLSLRITEKGEGVLKGDKRC